MYAQDVDIFEFASGAESSVHRVTEQQLANMRSLYVFTLSVWNLYHNVKSALFLLLCVLSSEITTQMDHNLCLGTVPAKRKLSGRVHRVCQ